MDEENPMNLQDKYDILITANPDLKYLTESHAFKVLIELAIEEGRQQTLDQILGDVKTDWAGLEALKIQHETEKRLLSQFLSLKHKE